MDQNIVNSHDPAIGPYLRCLQRLHRLEPRRILVGRDFLGTFPVSVCIVQRSISGLTYMLLRSSVLSQSTQTIASDVPQ